MLHDDINTETIFSKLPPYIVSNPSLKNFKILNVSHNATELLDDFSENVNSATDYVIIEQIFKEIFKKEDYNSDTDNFIDGRNKSPEDIAYDLFGIGSLIRSHRYFLSSFEIIKHITFGNPLFTREYDIIHDRLSHLNSTQGKIGDTFFMINHQRMKWSSRIPTEPRDNLIMLFDSVELSTDIATSKLSNKTIVTIKYDYQIIRPQYYYLIEDENSKFYSEFISHTRDNKIFKILNSK